MDGPGPIQQPPLPGHGWHQAPSSVVGLLCAPGLGPQWRKLAASHGVTQHRHPHLLWGLGHSAHPLAWLTPGAGLTQEGACLTVLVQD